MLVFVVLLLWALFVLKHQEYMFAHIWDDSGGGKDNLSVQEIKGERFLGSVTVSLPALQTGCRKGFRKGWVKSGLRKTGVGQVDRVGSASGTTHAYVYRYRWFLPPEEN